MDYSNTGIYTDTELEPQLPANEWKFICGFTTASGDEGNLRIRVYRQLSTETLVVVKLAYSSFMRLEIANYHAIAPHPQIIKVIDTRQDFPTTGYSAVIIEFAKGGTLRALLQKARETEWAIPASFLWYVFANVLQIADYLRNKANFIPADFLAQNLVLIPNEDDLARFPRIKLIDPEFMQTGAVMALSNLGVKVFAIDFIKVLGATWVDRNVPENLKRYIDRFVTDDVVSQHNVTWDRVLNYHLPRAQANATESPELFGWMVNYFQELVDTANSVQVPAHLERG